MQENLPLATEVKTSQVKKLGFSANLYIVEGESQAFRYSHRDETGVRVIRARIASRGRVNPVAFLAETQFSIDGLQPRPSRVQA